MMAKTTFFLFIVLLLPLFLIAYSDDFLMHPIPFHAKQHKRSIPDVFVEKSSSYWLKNGEKSVNERVRLRINQNVARNVIMFLGDGMSIPTIAATRVYLGGEEKQVAFEKFPFTALSKTYCVNSQVADSACSATAYLGGVKANYGTVGVTASVKRGDCHAMTNSSNWVWSIARWSQLRDKMTGFVTTSRVTHASPSGIYAHTSERNWESDIDIINSGFDPVTCQDIAAQLVFGKTGRGLNLIMGGGRSNFLPVNLTDEDGIQGRRQDKVNLITEWLSQKTQDGRVPRYISNREDLMTLDHNKTQFLMGLFNSDHMEFNLKRDKNKEPSLEEMTESAIKILQKSPNGYFLFIEGARIDMGHHGAQAKLALDETAEFSKAVQKAVDMTSQEDTLIVVTSDHAHTMSYSGYAERGGDIFKLGGKGMDNVPYTVLNYANGPGYKGKDGGVRHDVTKDNMGSVDYRYPGITPMKSETHGGDDVGVFAHGPWAHLFSGVMEQNVIPLLMGFAACVGNSNTICDQHKEIDPQRVLVFYDKIWR